MGIFTRFRDIVSSNINAMLDRAEEPEKLIRLMIREMEDTLVELKAACAGVMAETKKIQRQRDEADDRARFWADKAQLAATKAGTTSPGKPWSKSAVTGSGPTPWSRS